MTDFTEQQLDELFNINDIGVYLRDNYPITRERGINIYEHIIYPLCIKEPKDPFYKCVIHGKWSNIHFSSFVHHCLTTEPNKHKQFIKDKLFIK